MSNHFHLLVEAPNAERLRGGIDDKELLRRLALITEPKRLEVIAGVLAELKRDSAAAYEDYRAGLLARMGLKDWIARPGKDRGRTG